MHLLAYLCTTLVTSGTWSGRNVGSNTLDSVRFGPVAKFLTPVTSHGSARMETEGGYRPMYA